MRNTFFYLLFASFLFSQEGIEETSVPSQESATVFVEEEMTAFAEEAKELLSFNPFKKKDKEQSSQDGYTINYNTISILEYLRFASKICKVNFIYEEAELNFTITVVSDEPVTPDNVMATLLQVLRIHGLTLLEQGNNLVIHRSPDVNQIATLVTEGSEEENAPIVTRIFRVKNARPESVAAIIQPMISKSAILETSPETRQIILTDITANVNKIAALIENLDSPHSFLEIQSYRAKNNSPEFLIDLAGQIMNPIAQGNPFILVPQPLADEIYVVSTPELVEKAVAVFQSLDIIPKVKPGDRMKGEEVYVYKVQNRSGEDILKGMIHIAEGLQTSDADDTNLIQTVKGAKWIRDTNSIMLVGNKLSIQKAKEFLTALDVPETPENYDDKTSFFIYKPQMKSAEDISKSIHEMASNLKGKADPEFLQAMNSAKVNTTTQTVSFSGKEKYLARIRELLKTIDSPSEESKRVGTIPANSQFYIYKPIHQTGEELFKSLQQVASDLKTDKLSDPPLLHALSTMKWAKSTNSLLFTGDPKSLQKVQSLIASIDVPDTSSATFFQYHPKYATRDNTENYLSQVTKNLAKKGGDESLIEVLKSYKWIPESKTFMFYGTPKNLNQVKELLATFDTETLKPKMSYYIYKVQHTSGEAIEEDLDNLSKSLQSSDIHDPELVDAISKIRYIKQTNSLLISGTSKAVEEIKELLSQYDYPRSAPKPKSTNFFMYKPVHQEANKIQKSLKEVGQNLKSAGLADPTLLHAIDSSKYVSSTNTLIFTGTSETLEKIKGLIKEIDIAPQTHKPIQHVGKTTFLLYKLKHASGPQIVSSIKNMTSELKRSGNADKNFISALNSMKYVKETNSLFFAGNEEALGKVQHLVEQFDVTSLQDKAKKIKPKIATGTAGNFFVYKPQSVSGEDLENILQNFAEQLKSSGLDDPDLFQALDSVRYDPQIESLIFTGNEKAIGQIKELVKEFDVPSNVRGKDGLSEAGPSIQAIDNTSFLVYKLQFHKGDEIQNALRQIARDLITTSAPINKGLLNSINSIQWLEVTNSLLCSGDQDTLTRLRELIKNLDIPLKQVFIEMLVIQTTLTNALSFGLEWGANYKYRNKFGAGSYNSQPIATGDNASTFLQNFSGLTPPTEPTPYGGQIPVSSGFDLGVIGEIIKHNGQTFLTLGSLLSALQTDDETSVIMTPKVLTQDGRTSTIFVGENIPFVGSFVQNSGSNTVNTSNIEYRDIGLNLTITPVLGNSDIVTLDINLDRSQAVTDVTGNTIDVATQTAQGIVTSKTTMQTTVHVPDNNFLILSGMVNSSNAKTKAGIPCLGGLPLVGAAFSKNADTNVNSNIVIFIRPRIINSVNEMRTITQDQEVYFRDQQGTPFLEKSFDEAMELIKTIDDE